MFIEDIKSDFYNVLLGNRVLLLVHYDVDAICSCKILQNMFKCDNISYTLVPVGGIAELKRAYEENSEEIKYVVLLNCGGTIDLVDILQPEEDVVFFVLDAHKPSDVCNVYSDGQVRLLHKDEDENIPNFDDIFRDDDEEEEEEAHLGAGREALEALVERRRVRREWEDKRDTLMFNYTQFSYYGKPSACVLLELSWQTSRADSAGAWAAGVALQAGAALRLREHAAALLQLAGPHRIIASAQQQAEPGSCQVVLEKDVCLPLYREWSLESAVRCAPLLAPRLQLHTQRGETQLRQLLADMGFPLQQAREQYRCMDVSLRRSLADALAAGAARLGLPAPAQETFLLRHAHAWTVASEDVVYAIIALIEHDTIPRAEGFQLALSCLELSPSPARALGLSAARRALQVAAGAARAVRAARAVQLAGAYRHVTVHEGTPEASIIRGPLWLGVFARFLSEGSRPVLAALPLGGSDDGHCLLVSQTTDYRNFFGAAFSQAGAKSGTSVSLDYFDAGVVTLPMAQKAQFLDALTALLA